VLDDLMSSDSLAAYMGHLDREKALREALGRMMKVAPETLGFVRNTSHGLSIAAEAIPFRPGDTVVLPAIEYPANVYPWMAQAHRGVEVRLVPPTKDGLVRSADLIAACDATTRVLAVSWVQWGSGQRLNLRQLGDFCRSRGILFVVDVVQALGGLRLDLGSLPVDIAAAGCHKWLLAPGGIGVLYVRPEVFGTLLPANIGWNSVENPIDWERLHFDELKPSPSRFEEGTPSILAAAGLGASVALLESVGFDAVNDRVLELAAFTRSALAARGMTIISPEGDAQQSGIIAFRHSSAANEAILARLNERGVRAAVRCGNLRFSPHAYLNEADIEQAVDALA
jgi:cysteine desulfurase/selenocysteine lyase